MKTIARAAAAGALVDAAPSASDIRRIALAGLTAAPKTLPCSLFYDHVGAQLFEQICELPEYYPTRTEIGILRDNFADISKRTGAEARVIELGSGAALKTRMLLRRIHAAEYVPVDISRAQLLHTVDTISREFPRLRVRALCADYTKPLQLPPAAADVARTMIFFPGSTIGNFEPVDATRFLRSLAQVAGPRGGLLIGVDLQKDRGRLEAAYNDAQGVTREFNLNLLARLNRDVGADFDLAAFRHKAIYNEQHHRIEMHLLSSRDQQVRFAAGGGLPAVIVNFRAGETILTEYSYKYSIESFTTLADSAGWRVQRTWADAEQLFAVHWCVVAETIRPLRLT